MSVDNFGWFTGGLCFGIIIMIFMIACVTGFNEGVNICGLGEKMCDEHNLSYDKYEFKPGSNYIPTIYCKEEKSIEDGYLILNRGK